MRVLFLQIAAGLIAWLLAGFGVALLFKTRVLAFHVPDDPIMEISPAVAHALAPRPRR